MSITSEIFQRYANYINPFKVDSLNSIKFDHLFNKAQGCYLYDEDDNAYLDLVAGFGSNTVGHYHPCLVQELTESLILAKPNINPWGISPEAAMLAERLIIMSRNKLNKVYFASSGSEAIDSALKFSMAHTKRTSFVAVTNGFHGLTVAATSLTSNDFWRDALPSLPLDVDYINFNDLDTLEGCLMQKSVAAIVLEPIQGSSGAGAWDGEILSELAFLAKKHGALLIVDEVMTGLGRTGSWFAYQSICADLIPDIIVTSKGLTGGLIPLSAVLMTDEVYDSMFRDAFGENHAATFSANNLAVTCGLSVLEIVEQEDLLKNAKECGNLLMELLKKLVSESIPIGNINVTGLCISFEIVEEERYQVNAADVCLNLLDKRILTAIAPHEPSYIRLTPPLNINIDQINHFINSLKNCFHN
ncbi:MAG: aspartate aminotransferase family protein [Gammaproteobacteria bacterium]